MKLNKKYKDRLFCLLFGNEEYKENILSLYNALCNTAHTDVNDIKLYTIDNVIYIEMKNDVSILLDSYLHLWEQQSSYNPNMPLRGLMYFSKMYDRYIVEHSYNIYGSTLVKLPTPRYTVLYNGTSKQPAFMKLKLSDAFIHEDTSGDFEWTANMVNINHGMNDELLNNCRPLQEYMERKSIPRFTYLLSPCSCGSSIPKPTDLPFALAAPLLAASMTPGPPPVITATPRWAILRPTVRAAL